MAGALTGALRRPQPAGSLVVYPEFEILAIYPYRHRVLIFKPSGLLGKPAE